MQLKTCKLFLVCAFSFVALNGEAATPSLEANKDLATLLDRYYEERLPLFPLEATSSGDNRYNDKLQLEFSDSFRDELRKFYQRNLKAISAFNRETLNENDRLSFDIFKYEMIMGIEGLSFHENYIPFNQFDGLPLTMGQLGSGDGNQPFKTVQDHDNWIARASQFGKWADNAIVYFRKGMDSGFVLPSALVKRMIPQLTAFEARDVKQSLFYSPVKMIPSDASAADKTRLEKAYVQLIEKTLVPAYKKLRTFLAQEYLPKARKTTGMNAVRGGDTYYRYLARRWTTTNRSPEDIYAIGLLEVKRIRSEMEKVKYSVKFSGSLNDFFEYMKSDKQFMPFKTPTEVLEAYRAIQTKIAPKLPAMFGKTPKTKFEIRQTEEFRAASAAAEYNAGSPDGSRPGIFYVPIVDATQFNVTSGMEALFLHEAIPGHHYQVSLQQENMSLPKFRRFIWYGAYGEGWGLYSESLGKQLGCYSDPYQYVGALGKEIHRAIRLVVDVGMHTGKMTREEAITYSIQNEPISLGGATSEIERYMAAPGQALSYKIGALKIEALKEKYKHRLGSSFSLKSFHDELLQDGPMPLDVLEKKMDRWAAR